MIHPPSPAQLACAAKMCIRLCIGARDVRLGCDRLAEQTQPAIPQT